MKIVIGSDKSGYTLKEAVKAYLAEQAVEFKEIGTTDPDNGVPYYEVASEAAKYLQEGRADFAILLCGTGMGMAQAAGKYKGVRAACVESVYAVRMCRAINDSNALCMGGWIVAPEMGIEMTKVFLATAHTEGLEEWRKEFIKNAKLEFNRMEDTIYG